MPDTFTERLAAAVSAEMAGELGVRLTTAGLQRFHRRYQSSLDLDKNSRPKSSTYRSKIRRFFER